MKKVLSISLLFLSVFLIGQDVHFTQFTFAPQSVNPSLIGGYAGTYRASGIVRDQAYGGDVKGFRTYEANIDAPIIKGFRDQDWIGVGVSFDQSQRGAWKYTETLSRLGAAYHLGLDKKANTYISFGVQFLNTSRRITNVGALTPESIIAGTSSDLERLFASGGGAGGGGANSNDPSNTTRDWIAGISYTSKNKNGNFKIGLAASQFLRDNITFKDRLDDPFKLVGFFQMYRKINKKLAIEPAIVFQSIGNGVGFEISAHNYFVYKLKEEGPWKLRGGIGARTGSFAPQFLAGVGYKNITAGLAYDIPVNGVQNAPGTQQAFELAIGYLGIINKTPKPKPIILCPRL